MESVYAKEKNMNIDIFILFFKVISGKAHQQQ